MKKCFYAFLAIFAVVTGLGAIDIDKDSNITKIINGSDVEIGQGAETAGKGSASTNVAIGENAKTSDDAGNAVAIGEGAQAGENGVAIGGAWNAHSKTDQITGTTGVGGVAIGTGAAVGKFDGHKAHSHDSNTGAKPSEYSMASDGNVTYGTAIGTTSLVEDHESVALGHSSYVKKGAFTAASDLNLSNLNISAADSYAAWKENNGTKTYSKVAVVSMGTEGHTRNQVKYADDNVTEVPQKEASIARQVQNVAAGRINDKSTDAINGSQLYAVAKAVDDELGDIKDDVDDLQDKVGNGIRNFTGDIGEANASLNGGIINVKGGATDLTENNIGVEASGNTLTIKLAKNLQGLGKVEAKEMEAEKGDFKELTTENLKVGDSVEITNEGMTIKDGPSVTKSGIDAGGKKITNVAPGEISASSTDAVNGSQLYQVKDDLNKKIDDGVKNSRAGIASAAAIGNLPQSTVPGKGLFSMGTAVHQGQWGYAIGLSQMSNNEKWVYKFAASVDSQSQFTGALSVGFHF